MKFITGWMRATDEFLKYATIFSGVAEEPAARMEAFFKFRYGVDFIQMVGFHSIDQRPDILRLTYCIPDGDTPYFQYAARAVIWKLCDWEAT